MKLQKQLSRRIDRKEYPKWVITVPPQAIGQLGWKERQELKTIVNSDGLLVVKSNSLTYEEFKNKVKELLDNQESGMTWQNIKNKLNLPQNVPNNSWVKRLESDINLKRRRNGALTYWYVPRTGKTTVYTIGYEGRMPLEFVNLLKQTNIQQLVDVRELAFSRKNGFARTSLSKSLRENGIVYKHFPSLGSPREIRQELWSNGNYKSFFEQYSKALERPESQEYLTDLEGLAQVRKTAIMCVEKNPAVCHRSIIAKRLEKDGFKVINL